MAHIITANYQANPNIGLFCYANDKYCLVPRAFPPELKTKFENILKVPVYEVNAAGTSLLGVFFAGTDDCLLLPEIMFDSELAELESFNIKYRIIKSELTALGNNLLVNNKVCIANPDYSDAALKSIEKEFGFKVKRGQIAGFNIVGSLAKGNKKGILISPDAQSFEKKFIKDNLKSKITTGTLNMGSPYVSSGMVCNSHGMIIGDMSGGPEIQNADEALGFI